MQINVNLDARIILRRFVVPLALMGLCLALVIVLNLVMSRSLSTAQQGWLNLGEWDAHRDHKVTLAGEWLLFWDEFLSPDQVNEQFKTHNHFIVFPGRWNGELYGDKLLPAQGKGTVALKVTLPDDLPKEYVLKIPSLTTDYRLWINNDLMVRNPKIGEAFDSELEVSKLRFVDFKSDDENTVLFVFHVANYRSKTGGIWENLSLVPAQYRDEIDGFSVTLDVVTSFCLCLCAVFLVFLAYRHQRLAYLFLALWAALMAIRAGTIEERLLFQFFSVYDFEIQRKLEYGILYLTVPCFAFYLGHRFPNYFRKELHLVTAAIMGALIALVVITSAEIYGRTVQIFQAFVIMYGFLWFGALVEYVYDELVPGLLILCGSIIFITTTVNDILFTNHLISGLNLSQVGALIFLLFGFFLYRFEKSVEKHTSAVADAGPIFSTSESVVVEEEVSIQERVASAMTLALSSWENLGKDKIALAEESGLWRITNDDGTLKTRTLNKYLKAESIPKNPRIKTVVSTLCFIADQEGVSEDVKEELQALARSFG